MPELLICQHVIAFRQRLQSMTCAITINETGALVLLGMGDEEGLTIFIITGMIIWATTLRASGI